MIGAKSTKYDYICEWPQMSMQSKLELLTYETNKEDRHKITVGH